MFNTAAKLLLGLAAVALILGISLQVAVDDPTGFVVLLGIFLAAALAGLALTGAGIVDRAPQFGADAPPIEMVTVEHQAIRPSPWPLVAALAVGVLAVGLAVGDPVVTVGVIGVVAAAAGWLAQSWREAPSYTPREAAKVRDRLIGPIGLPVLALVLTGVIVISLSRVLLAVPKNASVGVAGGLAVVLLAAFFVLASRPRIARAGLVFLSGFAVASVVAAGSVGAASGYRTFETPTETAQGTVIQAQGTAYKEHQITVKAGVVARITFENLDKGTYHNIAVYTAVAGGTPVWAGEPVAGVKKLTYTHVFTDPGSYTFRCDFHPTAMIGTFIVQAGQ